MIDCINSFREWYQAALGDNAICVNVVDVGIYWRLLKYVISMKKTSSEPSWLANNFLPILGFWHPYKVFNILFIIFLKQIGSL
jgi:hypothetical protein